MEAQRVGPPRGVLPSGARGTATRGEHVRVAPSPALTPYLAHFWWVTWDLETPSVVETLPHPTVHLVFETPDDRGELSGVSLRRFTRTLEGRGRAFGLKFRPAVFGALSSRVVSSLRDRRTSLPETLASRGLIEALGAVGPALSGVTCAADAARAAESLLQDAPWPALPEALLSVRDLVERIEHDRSLTRVDEAARALGLDVRTLERRCRAWVGLPPKAVIARYRLIEAAERVQREPETPLAVVAAALGYSDQAHFSREMRKVVGRTPRELRGDATRAPDDPTR